MEYRVELTLVEWLPGGLLRLVEKLAGILANIANLLPTGYSITEIWMDGRILKFIIMESIALEERALIFPIVAVITAIISALLPVLILIGCVVVSWKIIDLFQEKEITKQIVEKSKLIEKATEAGLNPDQIDDLLSSVDRDKISTVLKWVAIIAGIVIVGVGGVIAYKELKKVRA